MAETSLVPVEKLDPVALFVKRDIEWVKKTINDGVEEMVNGATVDTASGRQKIKSAAFQVARSKTLFDKMRKDFTAKLRADLAEVNDGGKAIVQWCEARQQEVRQPLTEWEEAEKARQAKHEAAMQEMRDLVIFGIVDGEPITAQMMRQNVYLLEKIQIGDDWEEYKDEAEAVKATCVSELYSNFAQRAKYEEEQAELEKLRAEAEERKAKEEAERLDRERKEREERIAREAAEKAQRDAEEKDKREREESARREREAIEAKERAEREAKEAAAKAERVRIASEERAIFEKEYAIKQERERAAMVERERLAKEAAEKAEAEKKAANKRHRAKIDAEAMGSLVEFGVSEKDANHLVSAIAAGEIKHVTINY